MCLFTEEWLPPCHSTIKADWGSAAEIVVFLEGSSLSTGKAEAQRHLQLLSGTWSSFTPISQTGWSALVRVVVL